MDFETLLKKISVYVDRNYIDPEETEFNFSDNYRLGFLAKPVEDCIVSAIKNTLGNNSDSFRSRLFQLIDAKGLTDAECYNKAQLNRAHFNKIKNDPNYHVQKATIFALALALKLSEEEFSELLECAGYAFSKTKKTDVIIKACILNKVFDLDDVNQILYRMGEPLLGAGTR